MYDTLSTLSGEEKLLLSLCRLDFTEEQKIEIGFLFKEVKDWNHFSQIVNKHGIIALTAYNIHETGMAYQVPDPVMKNLDNALMQNIIRNTWLVRRWREVNIILSEAGVKHVLIKGMALEHTVYRSRGLRQLTDNDILVKKEDALKTWNLLQDYGFIPDKIKSPLHKKIITETGKHLPTLRKEGYALEIHHQLFQVTEKNKNLNEVIDNSLEIDVEGSRAYILDRNVHLDYLKEHLLYHQATDGSQLRLYLDMELLQPGSAPSFPDGFLINPELASNSGHKKHFYKTDFFSLPKGLRFSYLLGDIFPSLSWMKERHNCGSAKALLFYPQRLGKLIWLI